MGTNDYAETVHSLESGTIDSFISRVKRQLVGNGFTKLIVAPLREHSRKPDRVAGDIERLYDGPYVELFARTRRPGWDAWGNQTDRFAP